MTFNDPIDRIVWRPAVELNANDYNPNVVFSPELRLLEFNLVKHGWIQPILVTPSGRIIDGFHRWRLSKESTALLKKYGGFVPTATVDINDCEARLLTIRMNRAKGNHIALRMSGIVRDLMDNHGYTRQQIAEGIGATLDEVDLLHQEDVFTAKDIKNWQYSKAWYPQEKARQN